MKEIIVFIILSLIMSISLGAMTALMFTAEMDDGIPRAIVCIVIALTIGFGTVFGMAKCHEIEVKEWNNGMCTKCDTEWHFQTATRNKNIITYYYVCDNGHILKTNSLFQK